MVSPLLCLSIVSRISFEYNEWTYLSEQVARVCRHLESIEASAYFPFV